MNRQRLWIYTLFLLCFNLYVLNSQVVNVNERAGTRTSYTISEIRKITFNGSNLTLFKVDNSTNIFNISGLLNLDFRSVTTNLPVYNMSLESNRKVDIYPNPFVNNLIIDFKVATDDVVVTIFTLDGQIVHTQNSKGSSFIEMNLSHLINGVYLCKYMSKDDSITVKIIKK